MEQIPRTRRRPHPVEHFSLLPLILPLLLLAAATAFVLFLSSDADVNSLFTKCFPPEHVPPMARVPVVGPPVCCLVSFFHAALDSRRSSFIMNEILSFVGALLTVTTVESARLCNQSNWMIRNPTGPWLLFNLAGGAVVWQLGIVPAFLYHQRKPAGPDSGANSTPERQALVARHETTVSHRQLASSELHAIPISVALGYLVPCIPFLLRPSSTWILLWLFFPVYVSLIRQLVRRVVPVPVAKVRRVAQVHPEANRPALVMLYVVPLLWSVAAHFGLLHQLLFAADDRSPTTRAALAFVQADFTAIGITVLYWIAAEAGWRILLLSLVVGCLTGPGAGLCVAWVVREREMASVLETQDTGTHHDKGHSRLQSKLKV